MQISYLLLKLLFLFFITWKSYDLNLANLVNNKTLNKFFTNSFHKMFVLQPRQRERVVFLLSMGSYIEKFTQWSFQMGLRFRNRVPYLKEKKEKKQKMRGKKKKRDTLRSNIKNNKQWERKNSTEKLTFWISSLRTGSKFSNGVYRKTMKSHHKNSANTRKYLKPCIQ